MSTVSRDENAGDPEREWFEDRVMSLLPELLSAARHIADRPADAEDAVAEAVARAWEHRDDLRDRERFRGWLFRILRNCCLGRQRKRSRGPEEVPLREVGGEDDGRSFSIYDRLHQPFLLWWGNPEEEFFDRLLKEDLEEALEELSEPYRTAVVLADVQGLSYREISEALDVPVGTVRSRLARGRSRLQEALWTHAVDAGLRRPGTPTGTDAGGGEG